LFTVKSTLSIVTNYQAGNIPPDGIKGISTHFVPSLKGTQLLHDSMNYTYRIHQKNSGGNRALNKCEKKASSRAFYKCDKKASSMCPALATVGGLEIETSQKRKPIEIEISIFEIVEDEIRCEHVE
jgi:hypothetical protein